MFPVSVEMAEQVSSYIFTIISSSGSGWYLQPYLCRATHLCCRAEIVPEHGPGSNTRGAELTQMVGGMMDTNQLQTRLAAAIAAEDYELATILRDRLEEVRSQSCHRQSAPPS